jgi:hypothetical protein
MEVIWKVNPDRWARESDLDQYLLDPSQYIILVYSDTPIRNSARPQSVSLADAKHKKSTRPRDHCGWYSKRKA